MRAPSARTTRRRGSLSAGHRPMGVPGATHEVDRLRVERLLRDLQRRGHRAGGQPHRRRGDGRAGTRRGAARLRLHAARGRAGAAVHGHGSQPRLLRHGPDARHAAPVALVAGRRDLARARGGEDRRAGGGALQRARGVVALRAAGRLHRGGAARLAHGGAGFGGRAGSSATWRAW